MYSDKQSEISNKLSMSNLNYDSDSDSERGQEYILACSYYPNLRKRIQDALDNEASIKFCIIENNRKMSRASARTLPKLKEHAKSLEKSLLITRNALEQRRKEMKDFLQA